MLDERPTVGVIIYIVDVKMTLLGKIPDLSCTKKEKRLSLRGKEPTHNDENKNYVWLI